eukprot:7109281-Prymnesium_polylepis.1
MRSSAPASPSGSGEAQDFEPDANGRCAAPGYDGSRDRLRSGLVPDQERKSPPSKGVANDG